jgi:hypothetical protein
METTRRQNRLEGEIDTGAMGSFLAVSAFRDRSVDAVAESVRKFMSAHGVAFEFVNTAEPDPHVDAAAYSPPNGWTVFLWPEYFNVHDIPLCEIVSRDLQTLVSTVHVYDDDYWTHVLFDRGELVDRFASMPGYFADDAGQAAMLERAWAGDADRLADALDVAPEVIRPYLVHVDPEAAEMPKAFPDDESDLEDFWVFVDMWRRVGITYPEEVENYECLFRLGRDFMDRLPISQDGL